MTLDAMNWVWDHSQSKGNARIAVLFVADQVRTAACEVKLSYPALMRALNTKSKTTVSAALVAAKKLGELEIAEEAAGRRSHLYRLPKAVGYSRSAARSGPETGPLEPDSGPVSGPQRREDPSRSGPASGPHEDRSGPGFARSGPETGPPSPFPKEQASSEGPRPDAFTRCQPLIKAVTEAGITVSWSMKPSDWLEIADILDRAGIDAMVRFAVDTKATARQPIRYATFFLRGGWKGLPPASRNVPPPRPAAAAKPPYCGNPDCDEISRTRETEDDRGIRSLIPCPDCHPNAKGRAA